MVGQVSAAGLRRQAQPVLEAVKAVAALIDIGDEGMDLGRADARQKGRGKFGGLAAAMTPPQHQQDFPALARSGLEVLLAAIEGREVNLFPSAPTLVVRDSAASSR